MNKLLLTLAAALISTGAWADTDVRPNTKLVYPGPDDKLVYKPYTDKGDTLPDFSNCGYGGGGVALPDAEVKATVAPVDGDDGASIQAAIDRVSKLPLGQDGLRGAVLLKKGKYEVSGTIRITASGVVLRGEGSGEDGTLILATGKTKRDLIRVGGEGAPEEISGTRRQIADAYVPVGARSFTVNDASGYAAGQRIIVYRPSTAAWIRELRMDRIPVSSSGNTVQWAPGSKDLAFDRVVTGVSGNRITIDAPLVHAFQKEFGGGYIYRYEFPGRISNVGVENLRGDSEYDASLKKGSQFTDEKHAWNCVTINAAENAWVRNVISIHFGYSCVTVQKQAKWVTVENCQCLEPVSQVTGGRRYSFGLTGQLCLVKDCFSRKGRHDFVMHATVPGPNAFVNCSARDTYSTSEPHHRYAVGVLYDNVTIQGNGYLQAINRGNSGSGHGWSGAQVVFWNCTAPVIVAMKPPAAQNFIIGFGGKFRDSGLARGAVQWANNQSGSKFKLTGGCVGDCYIESPDALVQPASLYSAQLQDRTRAK